MATTDQAPEMDADNSGGDNRSNRLGGVLPGSLPMPNNWGQAANSGKFTMSRNIDGNPSPGFNDDYDPWNGEIVDPEDLDFNATTN